MKLGVIAAAGRGTRFDKLEPKQLARIEGVSLLEIAFSKLSQICDVVCVVTSKELLAHKNWPHLPLAKIRIQENLLGMGDAVFSARDLIAESSSLVTLWADQVGVSVSTIRRALEAVETAVTPTAVVPNTLVESPYVEFVWRDERLVKILESREGHLTGSRGYTDVGTFVFNSSFRLPDLWDKYVLDAKLGDLTGEVNFLPFLVWLDHQEVKVIRGLASELDRASVNTKMDLEAFMETLRGESL